MKIGERNIGPGEPVYIIAEIGVNHDGDVHKGLLLVDAAADAGADAIKLQYFKTDLLMSKAAKLAAYQKDGGEDDPVSMLRRLELPLEEMALVVERAHERGIHAIVTVFSTELVEPAMALPWDAVKSASPDIVHRPLLEALKATGKPMIVSTGASTMDEVTRAVGWLDDARERLALLQCVSCYPTKAEDMALGGIPAIGNLVKCVGYSDHAEHTWAWMPVAMGATILEKHLTWNRRASGPDHAASLDAAGFAEYVQSAHWVGTPDYAAFQRTDGLQDGDPLVGEIVKGVLGCERDVRLVARQSLVTTAPLAAGHTLASTDLTIKRPGTGVEAFMMSEVVGRALARDVEGDVPLNPDDLAG